ncbi:MAG: class I SAM-dependent methyltransferase, partial [Nanoarchaeota archaeon]
MTEKQEWYQIELKKGALEETIGQLRHEGFEDTDSITECFTFDREKSYEDNFSRIRLNLEDKGYSSDLIQKIFSSYQQNLVKLNNKKYGSESFIGMHQYEREYANDEPWPMHVRRLAEKVGIDCDMTILNVGINDGKEMEGLDNKIIGLDLCDQAMEQGIRDYNNICFIKGSANDLPIPTASVDAYISFRTLCVTGIYETQALLEANRALRNGGTILISLPTVTYDKGSI